ncbi:MAG: hypothetical protein RLZZ244_2821, partial [Verrucomicrobiota bacterium]
GRSPRQVAMPLIVEPEPLPEGEQVVMYLVKVKNVDPAELVQTLAAAMPASRTDYAPNLVALPKAQSILITENTALIRPLLRMIRATDVEPPKVEGEFVTLQRASAKDVVTMLEKLFEKPNATGGAAVARPAAVPAPAANGVPVAPAVAPGGGSNTTTIDVGSMTEDSLVSGKVRLTADERTNRIYVVARRETLKFVRQLIDQFDEDVRFNEPVVRLLKFVSSGDILEALVKAISDPGNKDNPTTGGNAQTRPPGANTTTPPVALNQSQSLSGGSSNRGSSLASNVGLQTTERSSVPQTVLVGNARVMADNRRNAIIVIGSADVKDKVFKLVDQLDVRAPQVMLSTVIGELKLNEDETFGFNYVLSNGQRSALTVPVANSGVVGVSSSGSTTLNLQNLLSDTRFSRALTGGAAGLNGFVTAGDALGAIVTALESTNKFRVTSRPCVYAINNRRAVITNGDEIAVATSTQSGLTGNTGTSLVSNSQVSYKPIELRLEVVPLINSDREVYLDIFQQVQDKSGTTKIDNNEYPTIANRAISTSLMVPNEGTLALGGLIQSRKEKVTSGIPILGRTPLIGPLFRSTTNRNTRSELVVLIRPSVSVSSGEDRDVRDRNMKPMRIPVSLEDTLGEEVPEKGPQKVAFRAQSDAVIPKAQRWEGGETGQKGSGEKRGSKGGAGGAERKPEAAGR